MQKNTRKKNYVKTISNTKVKIKSNQEFIWRFYKNKFNAPKKNLKSISNMIIIIA